MTEDEMVGWSITDEVDMSLGKLWELVMDRGRACCGSRGHKELDTTELN